MFIFKEIGKYASEDGLYVPTITSFWVGGNGPPLDRPSCGYNGEFCYQGRTTM